MNASSDRLLVTKNQATRDLFVPREDGTRWIYSDEPRLAVLDLAASPVSEVVIDLRPGELEPTSGSWERLLSEAEVDRDVVGTLELISVLCRMQETLAVVVLLLSEREAQEPRLAAIQGAAVGIVRGVAMEVAGRGSRINAIAYPRVAMPLGQSVGTFEEEVGATVVSLTDFLLSPSARSINGAIVPVDWGEHLYPAEGYEADFANRSVGLSR